MADTSQLFSNKDIETFFNDFDEKNISSTNKDQTPPETKKVSAQDFAKIFETLSNF